MIRWLFEFFYPPARWKRIMREEDAAEHLWVAKALLEWHTITLPKILLDLYAKPFIYTQFLKPKVSNNADHHSG